MDLFKLKQWSNKTYRLESSPRKIRFQYLHVYMSYTGDIANSNSSHALDANNVSNHAIFTGGNSYRLYAPIFDVINHILILYNVILIGLWLRFKLSFKKHTANFNQT